MLWWNFDRDGLIALIGIDFLQCGASTVHALHGLAGAEEWIHRRIDFEFGEEVVAGHGVAVDGERAGHRGGR